ncbi:MAG: A/G-specific adenine glycosylase [Patescibacteria group bacterium]
MTFSDFRKKILAYYRINKRNLPWRHTRDPYKILVSEVMLQQTQVGRVLVKYPEFLKKFPSLRALSQASERDVLLAWQGLGYNRRGLMLHKLAKTTRKIPNNLEDLKKLPGVGPYTAGAIMVFAFDKPVPMIETNIRRVFIHEFGKTHDREILKLVENTLDQKHPREWYYALMDYGAMLGKTVPNPNRRSAHYTRQSKFEGSNRQKRGRQLKAWLNDPTLDPARLAHKLQKLFPQRRG